MELDRSRLLETASKFPPPPGVVFSYGTAGFRAAASLLTSTVFRTGVLAALRSICTQSTTGVMITASHNPVSDNGVKVSDPGGGMLVQDWEPFADALANAQDSETFLQLCLQVIEELMEKKKLTCKGTISGKVLLARDTRPSGEKLLDAAKQGVEAVSGAMAVVVGVLTTPQLHWMVRSINKGSGAEESDYFLQLSNGFRQLLELKSSQQSLGSDSTNCKGVIVDGANGVGAGKLFYLQKLIEDLKLEIRNSGKEGEGVLNELVGADFVQKEKICPLGFGSPDELGRRCVSFDGDADRLVFFYCECLEGRETQTVRLLDGDKILALWAIFIRQQLQELCKCDKTLPEKATHPVAGINEDLADVPAYGPIKFGVVQTAYANGASTKFLKENLGLEVVLAPTGVKYLHHKAAEYDIGIYFEANGHGTVLFKEEFLQWLKKEHHSDMDENITSQGKKMVPLRAAQRLLGVSEVVNQAMGDALSGLLLVEAVLQYMGWSIQDWDAIYSDLPSRQLKVKVKDRASIKTTNAQTRVTSPAGLQDAIDAEVGRVQAGRAFIRPSGTEDVVRVYAEAATQDEANILARAVAIRVYQLAGGVGAQP